MLKILLRQCLSHERTRMHTSRSFINFPIFALVFAVFFLSPSVSVASAFSPLQVIQSGSERGLQIIKDSLFQGGPDLRQTKDEILSIVDEYFDFAEMAKRALGRPWKDQEPEKQQEFVRLFKQLLFNTYVSRVEATATPNTSTLYDTETVEGDYALVRTRVASASNPDVQIDYRLRLDETGWKVYDVVIEGISLVGNYRHQFGSILNNESFDSLLSRLRQKIEIQATS